MFDLWSIRCTGWKREMSSSRNFFAIVLHCDMRAIARAVWRTRVVRSCTVPSRGTESGTRVQIWYVLESIMKTNPRGLYQVAIGLL